MADPALVKLLERGVEPWNQWRTEHPEVERPDLSGADLGRATLNEANLSGANLRGGRLSGADLTEADLTGADLSDANLIGADLFVAGLRGANLFGARLSGARLSGADLTEADLRGADISGGRLSGAILRRADLYVAILTGADLTGAILTGADLFGVDFSHADLRGADLSSANLSSANLSGTRIEKALVGWTVFGATDLRQVVGLEAMEHDGPSTIGIDTVYASGGDLPEAFLRGAGVPDSFIMYMRSLVARPIDYYSCFISYSSQDQAFAERLYADLQVAGVRCWYAPEDMKTGARIRDTIDQSIRVHDKLLLVLSESSIHSQWVETEVETAFRRERQEAARIGDQGDRPTVLFPVRVDDAVGKTSMAWAQQIYDTRHITDFSGWETHASYQRSLSRLLRDLRGGEASPPA